MSNPVCVVMVKAPRAGAVKTRLMPALSGMDAARLAACFAQDVVANVRRIVQQVIVAYAPADGRRALEQLLPYKNLLWLEQQGDDLGARLEAAARDAATRGFGPIIIVGTDSPTLPDSFIETAIASLAANISDIVLAPTDDGGFCLVGIRECRGGLFQNIQWSTPLAHEQTAGNATRLKLRSLILSRWYDVDTYADLLRLRNEMLTDGAARKRAPFTYEWLRAHDSMFSE